MTDHTTFNPKPTIIVNAPNATGWWHHSSFHKADYVLCPIFSENYSFPLRKQNVSMNIQLARRGRRYRYCFYMAGEENLPDAFIGKSHYVFKTKNDAYKAGMQMFLELNK